MEISGGAVRIAAHHLGASPSDFSTSIGGPAVAALSASARMLRAGIASCSVINTASPVRPFAGAEDFPPARPLSERGEMVATCPIALPHSSSTAAPLLPGAQSVLTLTRSDFNSSREPGAPRFDRCQKKRFTIPVEKYPSCPSGSLKQ